MKKENRKITARVCLKSEFLSELFIELNSKNFFYAVLRNYEDLPEKSGRDIDILTNDFKGFKNVLLQLAKRSGFTFRIFRRYDSLVKFHFWRWLPQGLEVLEIDVMWSIRWKAIPLFPQDLLNYRLLKNNLFYILPSGLEAAISLIKHLIYQGAVREKYKITLPGMAWRDRGNFQEALRQSFGLPLTEKLYEFTSCGDWPRIEALVPELRRTAVLSAIKSNPIAQVSRWLDFIWWNMWKFIRPAGLFVVLIGPDGSGKSTVAEGLRQSLAAVFQGTRYYHAYFRNIPRLRDLLRLLGFKIPEYSQDQPLSERPTPKKRRNKISLIDSLKSLGYLIYYALDYILGYRIIFRSRGQGELIIFDRYYYDYLIQPGMALPVWFVTMMMRALPKPDLVVYLKNDPGVILSRKPELTLEELKRQGNICGWLVSRLPQGHVVITTSTPKNTIAAVANIVLDKICQKI